MHSKKVALTLVTYSFLVHCVISNSCNACDVADTCYRLLAHLKTPTHDQLPTETDQLLQALSFFTGITIIIFGAQQVRNMLVNLEHDERARQKQGLHEPQKLQDRVYHQLFLERKINQEIRARKKFLPLSYPQEREKKCIAHDHQIPLEEKLYDPTIDTGCSILDLERKAES